MVKLISITQGQGELSEKSLEEIIAFCARVSNPSNQDKFETAPKLLKYLIKHKHWSPFEMVSLTLEIKTSRGIAAQILRHRSFSFQEFSQRYSEVTNFVTYEARRQDLKNKQNSLDDLSETVKNWFLDAQNEVNEFSEVAYNLALEQGIAKECARNLLPLSTETTLYMSGTLRSWIHYIEVRTDPSTQKEHRDIAEACKKILVEQLPSCAVALNWEKNL